MKKTIILIVDDEAIILGHGGKPKEVLKRADEAMYEVKRKGKNNYEFAAK